MDRKGFFPAAPIPGRELSEKHRHSPGGGAPLHSNQGAVSQGARHAVIPFCGERAMLFHWPAGERSSFGIILSAMVFSRFTQYIPTLTEEAPAIQDTISPM